MKGSLKKFMLSQFISNGAIETSGFTCQLSCKLKALPNSPTPPPPPPPTSPPTMAAPILPAFESDKVPVMSKPDTCECGRSEFGRIIGGSEANKNQLNWQVIIFRYLYPNAAKLPSPVKYSASNTFSEN